MSASRSKPSGAAVALSVCICAVMCWSVIANAGVNFGFWRGVNLPPESISYAPQEVALGNSLSATPVVVGRATSFQAELPEGLRIDAATGRIFGTPRTVINPAQSFVVTAANSHGSTTGTISLRVTAVASAFPAPT